MFTLFDMSSITPLTIYLKQASCRRNFDLDVTLMDNFSRPMTEEAEVCHLFVYIKQLSEVRNLSATVPLHICYAFKGCCYACLF